MINKILTIFIILSLFILAKPVYASGILIEFETEPLFNEINFLPGDQVTKWIKVTNNEKNDFSLIAKVENIDDPNKLSRQMNITITDQDNNIYFNNTLEYFFQQKQVNLGIIQPNTTNKYYFQVNFDFLTPNEYQGKYLEFDIVIEYSGDTGGGGGGGNNNFKINSEGIQFGCDYAIITWLTSQPATSQVIYDTISHQNIINNTNYGYASSTFKDLTLVTGHKIKIENLKENTTYCFRPISENNQETKIGKELQITTTECKNSITIIEKKQPQLLLEKKILTDFANPGDHNIKYVLHIENKGNMEAYNAILTDQLPNGLVFSNSTSTKKIWHLGNLSPQYKKDITYYVDVLATTSSGIYVNKAILKADNHPSVESTAELKIKKIKVLGIELAPTGFNYKELLLLLLFSLSSLSIHYYFKKYYLNKNNAK